MKKKYLVILLLPLLYCIATKAQSVAINTDGSTANASALLDIKSTTKGILIPRMTKTERNSIAGPATGLMIFQTGPDSIGFHYYNGSSWSWVSSSSNGGDWKLTGNTGTNPATNFIGTLDNQPLRFRLNNSWAGEINPINSCISLGVNTLPNNSGITNVAIGSQSMRNNNTGSWNTALGSTTLYYNYDGMYNTALGYYALSENVSGDNNTAAGVNALQKSTLGSHNTAFGYFSLIENKTGSNNTAIGNNALKTNKYGSNNSAIGNYADVLDSNYTNATAIGSQAAVNCSNCLVLGSINGTNNATSNVNVGIGTTTPQALLNVKNGAILFDGTTGSMPVSGGGTRMMWIPAKAAFRAGIVSGTQWDNANIGQNSVALGYATTASGLTSTALGYATTASDNYSTAMGYITSATGSRSTALGFNTRASGDNSTSMGEGTEAAGESSTAMGIFTNANANYSTAMGTSSTANGDASIAMGNGTTANGISSTAIGYGSIANANYSTAMGVYAFATGGASTAIGLFTRSKSYAGFVVGTFNDSTNAANSNAVNGLNRVFQVGNGTADNARSNAVTVLQNGNTGIGVLNPARMLSVGTDIAVDENNTNNGTLSASLHFGASNSGEAIASNRFSGNLWGLDFYTNSINRLSIANSGNVGIGTTAPAAKLDVNGTTTTNGLQVGNGTVFAKMQHGSVVAGSNGTGEKQWTIIFPVAFTSATPHVFLTARNDAGCGSCTDAFSVSVRAVTAVAVFINIQRTDTNSGWGQSLIIDWFAVE